jgi:phosphatidylinositol 4-kinase B
METPQFWDDLIEVGNMISKEIVGERNNKLTEYLQEINEKLPANVYIPFFKEQIRLYTVLCVWKGRLFATKTRDPFSIWV